MKGTWSGLVALVTGASSGIGEEVAVQLGAAGARLVLAARSTDGLARVAARLETLGTEALAVPTDVADEAAVHRLVDTAVARFGRLDVLIANAGLSMHAPLESFESLAAYETLVRVNYLGSAYATHAALPHLRASRGRIVAVASLAALTGVPFRTGYCASKAAQAAFFDALRVELRGAGVSVTVAYPGFVATGIQRLGADGQPVGEGLVQREAAMSVETCARLILEAAARRRRAVVMTARGKVGRFVKLVAPGLVDRIAWRAVTQGR